MNPQRLHLKGSEETKQALERGGPEYRSSPPWALEERALPWWLHPPILPTPQAEAGGESDPCSEKFSQL